jgi:O-antigen ligase
LQDRDPAYVQAVIEGLKSDGGRVLLLRVGWQLVQENPLGLDGSRHTYQKLIAEKCGHVPMMQYAHSHNSWLDLALALGWLGAFAFASMMAYFLYSGLSGMKSNPDSPWAMALVLISLFWILRGFADSVYREHYIQMQLLLLMYLFGYRKLALGRAQAASGSVNGAG